MRYFKPTPKYLEQIKALCSACFNMELSEVNYVFEHNYISTEICFAVEDNESICSMLFTVPCQMAYNGELLYGHYIYGACTSPNYRHKGIMHNLIAYANTQRKNSGDCFSALLPANSGLYDFYGAMGYQPAFSAGNIKISKSSLTSLSSSIKYTKNVSVALMEKQRNAVCRKFTGTVIYNKGTLKYALEYAKEYGGGAVQCGCGYIIYARGGDGTLLVQELICLPQHKSILLGILKDIADTEKIMLRLPPWLNGRNEPFGMVKILSDKINREDFNQPYLGLTFD